MKKKIITLTIEVQIDDPYDPGFGMPFAMASVERVQQGRGDLYSHDDEYVSDASLRRLQRAQLRLLEQERET